MSGKLIPESKIKSAGIKGIPHSVAGEHVPERASWRIFKPVIDYKKCIKCLICWLYCPDSAYKIDKKSFPHADGKVCKGCGICANICPVKCIKMEREKKRV